MMGDINCVVDMLMVGDDQVVGQLLCRRHEGETGARHMNIGHLITEAGTHIADTMTPLIPGG